MSLSARALNETPRRGLCARRGRFSSDGVGAPSRVRRTDSTKSHRALVAHLSRSRAPAMGGVHAALHNVAAAIVGICIVVVVRIVVVIGVVVIIGIEAESEAVMPEVVIMTVESAIMEAMIVESAGEGATVESAEAAV